MNFTQGLLLLLIGAKLFGADFSWWWVPVTALSCLAGVYLAVWLDEWSSSWSLRQWEKDEPRRKAERDAKLAEWRRANFESREEWMAREGRTPPPRDEEAAE